ncbi:hypothetical protein [Chitinimonas lacunae]|uniref:Uncharacterized protein n=1 Tax=Chitinimonas lacunae TaxID=1963018 RepID=A0ABV8MRM2_9NEIS
MEHDTETFLNSLGERPDTMASRAERWGNRALRATLALVFVDIGFFIVFLLAQTGLLSGNWIDRLLDFWEAAAWITVAMLAVACIAGMFKAVGEATGD